MKLIRRSLEKDQSGTITLCPMDSEDMWYVYNLVQVHDEVETKTMRKIVPKGKDGTPNGPSVRKLIKLKVRIEKIDFDPEGSTLRLNGPVVDDHPEVSAGTYHTIQLELERNFTLYKDEWDAFALETLEEATSVANRSEIGAVVLQPGLAYICLVTDAMTVVRLKVEKSIPRKRRGDNSAHDKAMEKFLTSVSEGINRNIDLDKVKVFLLAAPGNLGTDLYNHIVHAAVLANDQKTIKSKSKFLRVHASSGHLHALQEALADPKIQQQLQDTRYGKETAAMDKFFKALNDDNGTAWYGPTHVQAAIERGGVQTLMITDSLFRSVDPVERKQYVEMAESVKAAGKGVLVFSSFHASGEQLDEMTGVACLTFYPMPELEELEE